MIVNLHWGTEYSHADLAAPRRALAERLTRTPAITAIVGQHVHVVQPIRRVHGKPVVFGEGNLVSNQTAACCPAESQDGLIALIDFVARDGRVRAKRVRYVPDLGPPPRLPGAARHARLALLEAHGRGGRHAVRRNRSERRALGARP